MKWLERLQNPFALVGQGFFLGGVLFFATHPESLLAAPTPAPAAESVVATITAPPADPLESRRARGIAGQWFAFRSVGMS